MFRNYILPLAAVFGIILAVRTVVAGSAPVPAAAPVTEPARAPFELFVAGAGIVEPISENISIATPVSGVVQAVHVAIGQEVEKGAALFTLDQRELSAELEVKKSALEVARAELADAKNSLQMRQAVTDARAVSVEELAKRKYAVQIAEAKVAGSGAEVTYFQTQLDRLVIRAPLSGRVLQVKIRAGEFASAQALTNPLIIMGDVTTLAVRVDIDENDAWRLKVNSPAVAFLRGNKEISAKLEFVRFEPFVVPKRSLTGESSERVDTRVLQVVYRFNPSTAPVYVGQLMDVFVQAGSGVGNAENK